MSDHIRVWERDGKQYRRSLDGNVTWEDDEVIHVSMVWDAEPVRYTVSRTSLREDTDEKVFKFDVESLVQAYAPDLIWESPSHDVLSFVLGKLSPGDINGFPGKGNRGYVLEMNYRHHSDEEFDDGRWQRVWVDEYEHDLAPNHINRYLGNKEPFTIFHPSDCMSPPLFIYRGDYDTAGQRFYEDPPETFLEEFDEDNKQWLDEGYGHWHDGKYFNTQQVGGFEIQPDDVKFRLVYKTFRY